jgi:hypothetical protein
MSYSVALAFTGILGTLGILGNLGIPYYPTRITITCLGPCIPLKGVA